MIIALDKNKRPLGFLTERRCRILMERKRAVLYRVPSQDSSKSATATE